MIPREIVQRTLNFDHPERVARSFAPSDILEIGPNLPEGDWQRLADGRWERVDAWGNVWGRVDTESKGEVIRGALEDLAEVETFPLPDFDNPALYDRARAEFAAQPDRWHAGFIHGFSFSMARKLRRLDRYFIDLLEDPHAIALLHDRIDQQIMHQMRHLRDAGADCVFFAEDWGTQEALFISPRLWRGEFKTRFTDLCAYAHSLGLSVWMHSCGKITAILPDLIETGIDLFQFDQPLVHGLETLAGFQRSGGVTFWCPVDIQAVLPSRDEVLIRRAARDLLDTLWGGRGGFIAGCYPTPSALGLEPGVQDIASDEFRRHGVRAQYA